MVAYHVGPSEDDATGEIAIAKHCNSDLIEEYKELLSTGVARYGIKEYHRRVGALFGYSKEDVEVFIASDIDCDCTKCVGTNG